MNKELSELERLRLLRKVINNRIIKKCIELSNLSTFAIKLEADLYKLEFKNQRRN